MKIFKYIIAVTCLVLIGLFQSCNEDGFTDEVNSAINTDELSWMSTTKLSIEAVEDKGNFVWEKNVETLEESWGQEEVEFNANIETGVSLSSITKIDFFVTMQEEDGYNYSAPFDKTGQLIESVSNWDSEGNFTLTFNADEIYNLFASNLQFDRSQSLAREGDLFEIHWVIHNSNGEILDSRVKPSRDSRFSFTSKLIEVAPPIWAGTFDYEWIEATPNAAYYGRIAVGQTGSISISQVEGQKYSMSNLMFGYYYAGAGFIYFEYLDGLVYVEGSRQEKWNVINIDGPSIDIALSYQYSAGYNEYCTVRVTRTDGQDWPTNIYTN